MKNVGFILLILTIRCYSQNLVPNGSFENLSNNNSYISNAIPWDSATDGSPDLFNTSFAPPTSPGNNFGYQYPHSGNGYSGAQFYGFGGTASCSPNNYAIEYLQVKLDTTLVEQQHYCASFYVNHSNRHYKLAIKNIGLFFSNTHTYIAGDCNLNYVPQITETSYVSDDSAWVLVYGEYVAHGGERYIIIGNFYSESTTDTLHLVSGLSPTYYSAYYYIDDVNVHCCTCDSTSALGINEENKEENVSIYPNPFTSQTTIAFSEEQKNTTIKVLDVTGREMRTIFFTGKQYILEKGEMQSGIYFVQITNENNTISRKVIIQ